MLLSMKSLWILTADLFSDATMSYIALYANAAGQYVSKNNFFQSYFYNIRSVAFGAFSSFIRNAYEKFSNRRPLYEAEVMQFRHCSNDVGGVLETHASYRAYLGPSESLSDREIIDLYIFLRNQETKAGREVLKTARQKCYELYRTYGPSSMAQHIPVYLNNLYKDYLYPNNYRNAILTLDNGGVPDILDTAAEIVASLTTG